MTTPTGTISMTDIQTEFGGSNPIGLTEYYAGGAYVPAGTSGVPSSGTISMNSLRGKTKVTPYTVTVYPTAATEGSYFTVSISSSNPIYGVVYWKITDYVAMTSSTFNADDFEYSSGQSYFDYEANSYIASYIRGVNDVVFDTGKFKVSVYADSSYTVLLGTSTEILLTDSYSATTPTVSRTSIYRYANISTGYTASLISMNTSGLEGASLYYEVYTTTPGQTLTSADIDAPVTLTGSQIVPTGGVVERTLRATAWDAISNISTDKNIVVRWKLGDVNGAVIGTSPEVTLYKTPTFSASINPTTIREGYTTTLTVTMLNIPIDPEPAASLYYTTSGTASLVDDFVGYVSSSNSIGFTANTLQFPLTAKIDTATESNETLLITFRINSITGTAFWAVGDRPPSNPPLTVESPAQIVSASATTTTISITNVNSYPESRTFDILWRARPAGTSTYANWNTPISGSGIVIPGSTSAYSTGSTEYTTNPDNHNGSYDYEIQISGTGYSTTTVTRLASAQTFPVYGLEMVVDGTNANGQVRTVKARITSTPTYPIQRNFDLQYTISVPGQNTWSPWATGFSRTVDVPVNSTFSALTEIRPPTVATAQYDVRLRTATPGFEIRESPVYTNIWL